MNFDINYFMINFSIISISIDKLLNIWMRITYSNSILHSTFTEWIRWIGIHIIEIDTLHDF